MSQAQWHNELRIPGALASQLREFRRRVWTIKLAEAIAGIQRGLEDSAAERCGWDRILNPH